MVFPGDTLHENKNYRKGAFWLNERSILKTALVLGFGLTPILLRKPSIMQWSVIYLINAATSHIMNRSLIEKNRLSYPIRLAPKIFKINIVYDYFICPLISILYCQSSYNSKLISTIIQGFLFAIPQVVVECLAERKTKLIKYKNGWTWAHSYFGIIAIKFLFRGLLELLKTKPIISSKILTKEKYYK